MKLVGLGPRKRTYNFSKIRDSKIVENESIFSVLIPILIHIHILIGLQLYYKIAYRFFPRILTSC